MNLTFQNIIVHSHGTLILSDVSGQARSGKITAIIGPNGSGKTTLMSAIAGLRKISAGSMQIDGQDLHAMENRKRAQLIGYLPQRNEVNWNISVRHIVELGRMAHHGHKSDHQNAVEAAMNMANVSHLANRKSDHLSGGELSRVLFARLLAGDPQWILLDEPMASLDLAHQLDMADLLKTLSQHGKSILIIMHDLSQAAQLADDIIIMNNGQIDAIGATHEILTRNRLRKIFGIDAHINIKDGAITGIGNFSRI